MGRGTRAASEPIALREQELAALSAELLDDPAFEVELEPLPDQRELRAADETSPRDGFASIAARSHPEWNEDRALCDHARGVALLFDGMGGYAGGERASTTACGSAALRLDRLPPAKDAAGRSAWLRAALVRGQENIREDTLLHTRYAKQDATFAAAVLADVGDERVALLASAGDSRVCHVRGEHVSVVTEDDDLLASMGERVPASAAVAARALVDSATTPEELARLPLAQMLFGNRRTVTSSLREAREIAVRELPVETGDLLIVCSDGVHDNLAFHEFEELITAHRDETPTALAEALCAAARERADDQAHLRAKDDDITAVVLPVV